MNKARREAIDAIRSKLEELRDEIDNLRSEEEDYYGNMPESFQNGEKGEKAQASIDALQEAYDQIDGAISPLETAVE